MIAAEENLFGISAWKWYMLLFLRFHGLKPVMQLPLTSKECNSAILSHVWMEKNRLFISSPLGYLSILWNKWNCLFETACDTICLINYYILSIYIFKEKRNSVFYFIEAECLNIFKFRSYCNFISFVYTKTEGYLKLSESRKQLHS
jgi:hypothetical protein